MDELRPKQRHLQCCTAPTAILVAFSTFLTSRSRITAPIRIHLGIVSQWHSISKPSSKLKIASQSTTTAVFHERKLPERANPACTIRPTAAKCNKSITIMGPSKIEYQNHEQVIFINVFVRHARVHSKLVKPTVRTDPGINFNLYLFYAVQHCCTHFTR